MSERRATITTTISQVLQFNAKRTGWVVHNLGLSQVFFSDDRSLTALNGFPIPSGGFFARLKVDGDDPRMAVYFLTSVTVATIGISESYEEIPFDKLIRLIEVRG